MFKFRILLLAICLSGIAFGQNLTDIIYQNTPVQMGTPRFTATAGAFTALGNDFSGVHLNPAGLAVFRHDEFGITMGFENNTVESDYYGNNQLATNTAFLFTNIGYVKTFTTDDPDVTWNFGLSYNRNNSFNQKSSVSGVNPGGSIINSWINNATGMPSADLLANGLLYEGLAYEAYLIDNPIGGDYTTEAQFGQTQQYWEEQIKGRSDEISISLATSKEDKLYLGGSFNIPIYRYESEYYYNEGNFLGDSISGLEWIERFKNKGFGVNIKLGAIYRPTKQLRVGVSLFSPTFYSINQEYEVDMIGKFKHSDDIKIAYRQNELFTYSTRTAPQANVGMAYVFEKSGFLSIDYTFLPTKWAGGTSENVSYLKSEIKNFLNIQHQIKVGGEIRLNRIFLRGGYSWLSNPYNIAYENSAQRITSFGIGYRSNTFTFDISYSLSNRDFTYYPYNNADVQPAQQNISQKPLLISASFRL